MTINCPQQSGDSDYTTFTFPAGELQLTLGKKLLEISFFGDVVNVTYNFTGTASIWELMLLCQTLIENNIQIGKLNIPYFPHGQQDRVNAPGECFSLRLFCDVINGIGADNVVIYDPHSDVTPALLEKCHVVPQWEIFLPVLRKWTRPYILISPDAGASKKIYKLAKLLRASIVQCSKERDTSTGEITRIFVPEQDFTGLDTIIVDDICVGGETFRQIAIQLLRMKSDRNILMTTHGIYSRGFDVFKGVIDEIYSKEGLVWSGS